MRVPLLLLLVAPLLAASPGAPGEGSAPLNVLWLTVEDMSPWIAAYGDQTVATPHLDAFAEESLLFRHAFASTPVCAPARTALLTGVDPTRMGAMHMRTRSRSQAAGDGAYGDLPLYEAVPPAWVEPFPRTLRAAGVHCTNNSKTDYQFVAPADTWDVSSGKAHWRDRPEGAPFFAVFNHTGTHESQGFPEARRRPEAVALGDVPVPPIYPDTPAVRDAMKRTYDNIAAMDAWFGGKLAELEEAGLADSTVVFFFSDHGVGLPRGKRSLYGTGTRVPLMVRFPEGRWPGGIAPGTATERLVSFVDLGPTVQSLMGVEPDPRADGRAFLGEHAAAPRALAFFHADRFDAARDRARGVTDGRRLVIRNLMPEVPHLIPNAYRERLPMTHDLYALRDGAARAWTRTPAQWQTGSLRRPEREWYDSEEDPWEVRNLAGGTLDGDERVAFEALEAALDRWMDATGDLGLLDDETAMVHGVLWGGERAQPGTAAPRLDGARRITCPTEGAKLSVRAPGSSGWRPYDGAALAAGQRLEVRAHRLGFTPSEVVTLGD